MKMTNNEKYLGKMGGRTGVSPPLFSLPPPLPMRRSEICLSASPPPVPSSLLTLTNKIYTNKIYTNKIYTNIIYTNII